MATKEVIKKEIESHTGTSFSSWRIGITEDWEKRKKEWKDAGQNVTYWYHWQAASSTDAKDIESYYLGKNMKGGSGGQITSRTVYVYIF
jgi:hypothetical protein